MLGIIGGTGLTQLANLEVTRREVVRTPWGEPSGALTFGQINGRDVIFLARHGYGHTIPPHMVNYRANIWALQARGATEVVSVASVGGIRADLGPGVIAVPHQIIDYTWGRKSTFYEGDERGVVHVDFTHPYCAALRARCLEAARTANQPIVDGGVYACSQGPRLETAAEIDRMEGDGADMVGMTGMPEAGLARELELCYATIAVVANYAAGRATSSAGIRMDEINATLQTALSKVRRIIEALVVIRGD
ncbi:MAG: S-methyl-5'-thioinosine phosphorylase [Burkholderiales bacterium]|nr:S-methyl-5'-thioinosine phosphorylase [Burkholderiales bacterium]